MKKISLLILFLIALTSLVLAVGVTYPRPKNIQLMPGQSSYFIFQIQNTFSSYDNICTIEIQDLGRLKLFFEEQYNVPANEIYIVKAEVLAPRSLALGDYASSFCVRCRPVGGNVVMRICGLPVTVNVVRERTRINQYEPLDDDGDGVLWNEDECPHTVGEQAVHGCSCEQILNIKLGQDVGLYEQECKEGILKIFAESKAWASYG